MRHDVMVLGLVLSLLAGCSGGDTSGPSRRNRSSATASGGASGSSAPANGDAGPGSDGEPSGFGNPDASGAPGFVPVDGSVAGLLDGGGEDPDDDDDCGSITLEPMVNSEVEKGAILVIFDDSGSMSALWGDKQRWLVAAEAIRDSVGSLSEFMTVGAIIFPSDNSCAVDPIDAQGQIRFLPGATFLTAWDRFIATNVVRGGTPLGDAMLVADTAIQEADVEGQIRVVVLTDGAPGCNTAPLLTMPAQWLTQGIKTYVVGLPGSESAVTLLDQIAAAGGTDAHIDPDDPRTLRRQLAEIVGETVVSALPSCTIPLDPPAPDPDDVHLIVTEDGEKTEAARDLGDGGGWRINDDGDELELYGNFCDQGLAGKYQRISIEFGCVDLPPLPEPPPVI